MSDDSFDDDIAFDDEALQQIDLLTRSPSLNQASNVRSDYIARRSLGIPDGQPIVANRLTANPVAGTSRRSGPAVKSTTAAVGYRNHVKGNRVSQNDGQGRQDVIELSSSDEYDCDFDVSMDTLEAIDNAQPPRWGPSTNRGIVAQQSTPASVAGNAVAGPSKTSNAAYKLPTYQASRQSVQTHLPFRPLSQKKTGKKWDRTAFAKTGRPTGRKKGKSKARKKSSEWDDDSEDYDDEEQALEFDQFPRPFVDPNAPVPPPKHQPMRSTTDTYIYPINFRKRDYQYEIVRACFLENTLVALPTGLGKTFIAGVVLLNFYRWFPTGKLVFLMPTKPLVSQQHEACQNSCGIPAADTATVTGDDPESWRDEAWSKKRVIYATPQSFMIDMVKERVDPKDIVLLIIDEAHKASGNHSYVQCVAYLHSFHPHFRIVALTATPGRTTDKVQEVVDNLHISRVEIREAEAPEIQKYMFKKETFMHPITMSDEIQDIALRWGRLMKPLVAQLIKAELLSGRASNVMTLKAFTVRQITMSGRKPPPNAYPAISLLGSMAQAMGYLLEFSLGMFYQCLLAIAGGSRGGKGKPSKAGKKSIRDNPEFRKILDQVEGVMNDKNRSKASQHPKLEKARDLLVQHLAANECDEKELGRKTPTRCMVFCSFRGCVGEIVQMLNEEGNLIRAHKFVGRSGTKDEADKGLTQAEQKAVVEKFKSGVYNVLVATSIGEEGLDIGEVDFIIIYNCPSETIKMLQRIGRAGRKRDGKIHVLMTEEREDSNWDQAMYTHREIQAEIIHGRNIELYDDVQPLLPEGKLPECVERVQRVDPWVPEIKKASKRKASATNTAKRTSNKRARGAAVPDGAQMGFVSASKLTTTGKPAANKAESAQRAADLHSDFDADEDLPDVTEMVERSFEQSSPQPPKSKRARGPSTSATNKKRKPAKQRVKDPDSEQNEGSTSRQRHDRDAVDFLQTAPERSRADTVDGDQQKDELLEPSRTKVLLRRSVGVTTGSASASPGISQTNSSAWMLDISDDDEYLVPKGGQPKAVFHSSGNTKRCMTSMGPPALPNRESLHRTAGTGSSEDPSPIPVRRRILPPPAASPLAQTPEIATQGVSRVARRANGPRRVIDPSSDDSSPILRRSRTATKRSILDGHQFLDTEVGVSDPSDNEDSDSSGQESESDRRFAGDFQPTQAPAGYDQRRAYLAGLSTQVPNHGPAFAPRAHQHDNFLAKARKPVMLTQEQRAGPSSEYLTDDSFVVDDDVPLEFDSE